MAWPPAISKGAPPAVNDLKGFGYASAAANLANDHSLKNLVLTGLGLIPGPDVPLAFGSAAVDVSRFAANQVMIPVFTPDALQSNTANINGTTVSLSGDDAPQ